MHSKGPVLVAAKEADIRKNVFARGCCSTRAVYPEKL